MVDREKFGARLRKRRLAAKLTQEQLAAKTKAPFSSMGVSRNTIARIERGERGPSIEMAIRLARALGCSFNDLMPIRDKAKRRAMQGSERNIKELYRLVKKYGREAIEEVLKGGKK